MMHPETKQCVIDPFQQPFADPATTTPAPVVTAGLSPYTQMAPVTLGQLQPTRLRRQIHWRCNRRICHRRVVLGPWLLRLTRWLTDHEPPSSPRGSTEGDLGTY